MRLSLIAAVSENGVIGRDQELPWHLPADLRRFKRLTMGHHLLVGRKTFAAIGRPLAGRLMVVISRSALELPAGVQLAHSLDEAIEIALRADEREAFVAGGGEIFRQALPKADRLYLTRIKAHIDGDTRFPRISETDWKVVERQDHPADDANPYAYSFLTLVRSKEPESRS